jgi:predicted PurR-regulated permease PerM
MRIDWRRALVVELALLAACALAIVAWLVLARVLHTVLLLLMAAAVAFAVGPLVAWGLAEAAQARAPAIDARLRELGLPVSVQEVQTRAAALLVDGGGAFLGGSLAALAGLANVLVDLLLVLVMSLYLVLDGARLRTTFLRLVPAERRTHALFVEETVVRVAGGYLRGQLVMALSIGVLAGLGAMLFGLRYPVVVGVVAGLLELVPMFGPVLGAVPTLLLALVFEPFPTVLWVGLYFLAIQQVESNLLGSRITGRAVGLHPLAALLALLAGFEVAGVLGGLFAVPVVGVAWVLIGALHRRLGHGAADPPVRRGWRFDAWRAPRAASRATSIAAESATSVHPLA